MSKETDARRGAVAGPVERPVRPAVWWHRAGDQFSVAKDAARPFARCWEPLYDQAELDAAVAVERERWQRIAKAAQAVTHGAEDIGDFLVSSSLMAALALALDEGPNVC